MTYTVACTSPKFSGSASRFTGKERDTESGNDYFGARYYASSMGRFLSPDPGWFMSIDLTNPQSLNLYSYVLNNPFRFVDPTGMVLCDYGQNDDGSEDYEDADDENECTSNGGTVVQDQTTITVNGNGSGSCSGDCPEPQSPSLLQMICASLPTAGVQGISGSTGGIAGPTGSLELVTNYRTGQVSGFAAGGTSLGWNGGASAAGFTGPVWGLNGDNSNYSGGFTSATASVGTPAPRVGVQATYSSSSGGIVGVADQHSLAATIPDGKVNSVTFGANVAIVSPPVSGTVAATNYSQPLQLGKYWTLASLTNLADQVMFLANQGCSALGY